jgi:drug/metabolite transporter (DMT)-like permease
VNVPCAKHIGQNANVKNRLYVQIPITGLLSVHFVRCIRQHDFLSFQFAQLPSRALIAGVPTRKNNALLAAGLLFAIFLWGGNNTGTKLIVGVWPPIWTGGSRFLCAGLLLLPLVRWTPLFGTASVIIAETRQRLWWRGGLSLAAYIVTFNSALRYTSASHVALYLGASPVWALLWEGQAAWSVRRYTAAVLALSGVVILFWPALGRNQGTWLGEILGLTASVLWANYGRECRALGTKLSGAETSAHTMWRAGLLLLPLAAVEIWHKGLVWRADLLLAQTYCILAGGVIAFAIWNQALRYWPTSQVLLFNNLIPLSTMTWAHFWLGEKFTSTFWFAMTLIIMGVIISQVTWPKPAMLRPVPPE